MKRIVSFILALVMLLGLIPMNVLAVEGNYPAVISGHLQTIPKNVHSNTNIWPLLEPDSEYFYAGTHWGVFDGVVSVTIPISPGDQIYASSFARGIRVTFFDGKGVRVSISSTEIKANFSRDGYITAPEGAVAVNIPMWEDGTEHVLKILTFPRLDCTDHVFLQREVIKQPGLVDPGSERRVCEHCGYSETADIPELMQSDTYAYSCDDGSIVLPYRIYYPSAYGSEHQEMYPVVIFYHGAGSRGADNRAQVLGKTVINRLVERDDCIIIAPQCNTGYQWVNTPWGMGSYDSNAVPRSIYLDASVSLLDTLILTERIHEDQVYAIGLSMGGYAVWNVMMEYPEKFAAVVPICGAGDPSRAGDVAGVAVWAFHGDADPTVPVSGSREMIAAIRDCGNSNVKYTEYPGLAHDSWTKAFAEPELLYCMFAQKKHEHSYENGICIGCGDAVSAILAHIGVSDSMGNTSGTVLEVIDFPALPYCVYETGEGIYGLEDILSTKTDERKAYFVDSQAGSDDNSGTTVDDPFRTLKKALTTAAGQGAEITILNDDAVFFANELYGNYAVNQTTVIRAKTGATILCGIQDAGFTRLEGSANTYVSGDLSGFTIQTSDGVSAVVDTDSRNVDEMGIYRAMLPVGSVEEVETTRGSYCYDADTARMYVNPRYNIASIYPLTATYSFRFNLGKATGDTLLYLENLNVVGNFLLNGRSAADEEDVRKLEFVSNNCTFQHNFLNNCVSVHNFNSSYMVDCRVGYSLLDGYNYHANHLTTAQRLKAIHVEVNCQAENCGYYRMKFGVGSVNNNLSTAHEGINVLRVNFSGHDSYGPQIADVNGCRSVNIDYTISNSYQCTGSAGNFQFTQTSAIRKANITLINCSAYDSRSGELRLYSNVERTTVVGGNLLERNFCKVYGELLTEVQQHTHSYAATVIAPDCTEQGYTAYRCILCDDGYADSYVNALGHSYGAWNVAVAPTCTNAGTERRECLTCDYYESRTVVAWGHAWSDWAVLQEPTYIQPGIQERTCIVCDDREQEELPRLEILYGDANGDDRVNGLDLVVLRQYLAGWDVTINSAAADVTSDRKCNALDLIRLRQHLAGWNVTLG